jgi:hypothetical protein
MSTPARSADCRVALRYGVSAELSRLMYFTIQYFGTHDRLMFVEAVEVDELDYALDRARAVLKESQPAPDPPQLMGYVILDGRGRQVARGYRRDA